MDPIGYRIGFAIGYGGAGFVGFVRDHPGLTGVILAVLIGLITARFARFR
jgi:hypothetical protein